MPKNKTHLMYLDVFVFNWAICSARLNVQSPQEYVWPQHCNYVAVAQVWSEYGWGGEITEVNIIFNWFIATSKRPRKLLSVCIQPQSPAQRRIFVTVPAEALPSITTNPPGPHLPTAPTSLPSSMPAWALKRKKALTGPRSLENTLAKMLR